MNAPDYQGRSQPANQRDVIATVVISVVLAVFILGGLYVASL